MLIAGLTLASLIIIEKYPERSKWQFLLGVLLGFMVLAHFRTLAVAGPAILLLSHRLWKKRRQLPWPAIIPTGLFVLYYFLSLHHWFGVWDPQRIVTANINLGNSPFNNVPAMLFDSNRGLLIFNPVTVLIFVGLPLWLKFHRSSFFFATIITVPSMVILAFFTGWNGGHAPVGRYLVDMLPVFMPAVVLAIRRLSRWWQRAVVAVLIVATLAISLDAAIQHFPLIDSYDTYTRAPLFQQLATHTGLDLDKFLPSYSVSSTHPIATDENVLINRHGALKVVVDLALLIVLTGYGYYLSKAKSANGAAE